MPEKERPISLADLVDHTQPAITDSPELDWPGINTQFGEHETPRPPLRLFREAPPIAPPAPAVDERVAMLLLTLQAQLIRIEQKLDAALQPAPGD